MIRLAFYKGTSLISRLIRFQTRGEYSHVGVLLESGKIIEAWHHGGVLMNASLSTRHSKLTEVDLYTVAGLSPDKEKKIIDILEGELGKDYDFGSVARFISRRSVSNSSQDKWFCSELVHWAFARAGVQLLATDSWRISPTVLAWSPYLEFDQTVRT